MAKTTKIVQSATDWMSLEDGDPPEDVQLLIVGVLLDDANEDIDGVEIPMIGYWSPKYKVFIEWQSLKCISELFRVTGYHVITSPTTGKNISPFPPPELGL